MAKIKAPRFRNRCPKRRALVLALMKSTGLSEGGIYVLLRRRALPSKNSVIRNAWKATVSSFKKTAA